ncbi:MAG: hypothetical protein P8J87_16890 [Verrucomicrobiales bacterium]|nr:hypothetical protein [Verrucomicrobiales bacterium]
MIKATITPATGDLTGQLFRHAKLEIDDRHILDLQWQFGFRRRGLHLTAPASNKTLATTTTKTRGFPPRTHYILEVTGNPPGVPTTSIHYRWFNPRLQLGEESFTPQMLRTGDDTFLAFDTRHWGFLVNDYETALHLHVAEQHLLLPIAFTAYFVWTYHTVGRG